MADGNGRNTHDGGDVSEGSWKRGKPLLDQARNGIHLPKYLDIIGINQAAGLDLFEGDIVIDKQNSRNTLIDEKYRWPLTIPYYLEDNLEMNAKGAILKAFDRYRLKTCINFKPWAGEKNYISVFKGIGCYSSVGDQQRGKQQLSIGSGCDSVETIQHEFLHALGFYHEQSRSDRDDYVTILRENIQPGKEHNFQAYDDKTTSFLNVSYDYTSVMHYSKTAFQIGNEPTIIPKNLQYIDIMGQQVDFSESDVLKLNRMYNCSSSLTFLNSCSFEGEDICGMLQDNSDTSDWQRVSRVPNGPSSDHTFIGKDKSNTGYFMHFSTSAGNGSIAILESRLFYPKRGYQCLEFFYYHSGSENDQLQIWIKEYPTGYPNGVLKFVDSVSGKPANYWQLHFSSINTTNKFRFVFQGVKGSGNTAGGISIDDINLSETRCPQNVWHIRNFSHDTTKYKVMSPPYYSNDGYAYQIMLWSYATSYSPYNIAAYLYLITGKNDRTLQWPCSWRQATVEFMDQNPNMQQRTMNTRTITTDPNQLSDSNTLVWDNPAVVGYLQAFPNGTLYKRTGAKGTFMFTVEECLYSRDFLKGGDAFIFISMEGHKAIISYWSFNDSQYLGLSGCAGSQMNDSATVRSSMSASTQPLHSGQTFQETLVDVDAGKDKDIFDINQAQGLNLFEGDIQLATNERNSIIGDQYRWPIPVPYYLEDSLEINAKALVLEAFERYRLKSCIDFKPWEGEPNYISVFKESGCWSYIGNLRRGKQQLSLGANCDRIATIQHEFLHSLGFWHEQSRADRDDYVIIEWDRIQNGTQNNFNTYNDTRSSALNVPYDYTSVMHYSKTAFQVGSEPTIVTRIAAFSDVIGQRMDFSDYDLEKLNRLYNCSNFLTFLDTCDFEYNNICGMIQGTGDNADWEHVLQNPIGPSTDHTNLGNCKDSGYFMHFSTRTLNTGNTGLLESRLFYPKRGFQCLEFFYFHNGHETDTLNIWIREYTAASPNGTLKFVTKVDTHPADYWQLYHVSISTSTKFRVVFEGVKGTGNSNGGFSIDDINFSETKCPHFAWHIRNFADQINNETLRLYSPPYYSKDGYAFQVQLRATNTSEKFHDLAIYFHLISGENDNTLQWPCSLRQASMVLMDQNPDIRKRMSNLRSVTTDPYQLTSGGNIFWDKPELVGDSASFSNGTQFFRGPGFGTSAYITHDRVHSRDFLKGGDAFLLISVEDVTYLNTTQTVPSTTTARPTTTTGTGTTTTGTGTTTTGTGTTTTGTGTTTTTPSIPGYVACPNNDCKNDGICIIVDNKHICRCKVTKDFWYVGDKCETKVSSQDTMVIAVSSSVTIFVVMLGVTLVSVYCLKKKHKKQIAASNEDLVNDSKF
ncbi:uncharacterized protein ACMZJ9_009466 [Mantella aurantiaca]